MTTLDRLLITINIWKKRKSASDTLLIFTAIFSIKNFFQNNKHYCITDKPSYCKVFSKTVNEEIIHTHTHSYKVWRKHESRQTKQIENIEVSPGIKRVHLHRHGYNQFLSVYRIIKVFFACFCFN